MTKEEKAVGIESSILWGISEEDVQETSEEVLERRLDPEELAYAKEVFSEGIAQYKDDIIWRAVDAAGRMNKAGGR